MKVSFANFCARNEEVCGWQPAKVIRDQESMWVAIHESFIRKMLYLNQFRKFSPTKVPSYLIGEVVADVATPTYYTHEPF